MKSFSFTFQNFSAGAILSVALTLGLAACKNTVNKNNAQTSAIASPTPSPTQSSTAKLIPSSGKVTAKSGNNSSATFDIYFDAQKSEPITQYCNTLTADTDIEQAKPCYCEFSWVDRSIGATGIARRAQGKFLLAQRVVASCEIPKVFSDEIKDGTKIEVSIVKGQGNNTEGFSRVSINYTKNPIAQIGDFTDADGFAYQNVYRYTCYEKFKRGLRLTNQWQSVSASGSTPAMADIVSINGFCYRKSTGEINKGLNCAAGMPELSPSGQSYYYNLFAPSKILTDLSSGNTNFHCPEVTLKAQQLGGGAQKPNWPLDSQFALAVAQNPTFAVPVEAYSRPYPESQGAVGGPCIKSNNSSSSSSGTPTSKFVLSCLGFGATPNPDGSCPNIKNTNGTEVPTFRLRRYIAVYPPKFEPNGELVQQLGSLIDMVYIQDRPFGSNVNPTDSILGPKPCPFAFYDHSATVFAHYATAGASRTGQASYIGANRRNRTIGGVDFRGWAGINIDGTELPNGHMQGDLVKMTRAFIPVFTTAGLSAKTVDHFNRAYIRPPQHEIRVHYEEDHSFLACAPRSNVYREPPLHFFKDTNNEVRWCAEVYPNFNSMLNMGTEGLTRNKDGAATAVTNSAEHCGTGTDSTCKRAVTGAGTTSNDAIFPLLASGLDVEDLLEMDKSYACKRRNTNGTPTQGCCSNVTFPRGPGSGAHLEPNSGGTACQTPTQ